MGIRSLPGMDSGVDVEMILRPGQSGVLKERSIRIVKIMLSRVEGEVAWILCFAFSVNREQLSGFESGSWHECNGVLSPDIPGPFVIIRGELRINLDTAGENPEARPGIDWRKLVVSREVCKPIEDPLPGDAALWNSSLGLKTDWYARKGFCDCRLLVAGGHRSRSPGGAHPLLQPSLGIMGCCAIGGGIWHLLAMVTTRQGHALC